MLLNSEWLDDSSKLQGLQKLDSMALLVGYPDWIMVMVLKKLFVTVPHTHAQIHPHTHTHPHTNTHTQPTHPPTHTHTHTTLLEILQNDTLLDEYHQDLRINYGPFFYVWEKLHEFNQMKKFSKILDPVNRRQFQEKPAAAKFKYDD